MKFLFMSEAGDGVGFAHRINMEGDKAKIWVKDKRYQIKGGLVPYVSSLETGLAENPDAVIVDSVGMGKLADYAKKKGFKVYGGGEVQDVLENDRDFAMNLVEGAGIKCPPYVKFPAGGTAKAQAFVKESKKRYVIKPNSKADCSFTYVSKSAEDMINYLDFAKKSGGIKGPFVLQEFVDGVELSTEVLFYKGRPIYPADATIELKKLLVGDLGPNTGCMASTVWRYAQAEPKIVKDTFLKLYDYLRKEEFTGPLDINCIVTKQGAMFLEFTPRWGYSASYVWVHLLEGSVAKNMYDLAAGNVKELKFRSPLGFGLRISIPPYPLDTFDKHNWHAFDVTAGHEVKDYDPWHTFLLDVKTEDKKIVTAGLDGVVCELVRKGNTENKNDLQKIADEVYKDAKKLSLSNKQYRIDGVERALKQIPGLQAMGYESWV